MTLTIALLRDWFNEFNKEYFDNELPMPTFALSTRSKRILGKCQSSRNWNFYGDRAVPKSKWYNFTITMNILYNRSEYYFKNTFIHEMIHEWQVINFGHGDHLTTFQRKAREINYKGGWKIRTHSNLDEEGIEVAEPTTRAVRPPKIVCVMEKTPTTRFVACLGNESYKRNIELGFASQKPKFYKAKNPDMFVNYARTGRGATIRGKEFRVGSQALQDLYANLESL